LLNFQQKCRNTLFEMGLPFQEMRKKLRTREKANTVK